MNIIQCEQGSPEWYSARCGIPTASNFDKIICLDGKPSKQREKYLYRLAGERITGISEESYTNGNMERGKVLEAEARSFLEFSQDIQVQRVGLCVTENPTIGASPDGLIGEDGGSEIKCPIMSTHVSYLLNNDNLLKEYFQQVQGNMFVTGRMWWYLLSYYPGLKPVLLKVARDDKFISALQLEMDKFCVELDQITERIR